MKAIIITVICFLIAGLLGYIAFFKVYQTFNTFVGDTILQMLGTIFAINIGVVPFLHYELNKLEIHLKQPNFFKDAKKEIRENAFIMTVGVLFSVVASIVKGFFESTWVNYTLSSFILGILFLSICMLFDIVLGILAMNLNLLNQKDD